MIPYIISALDYRQNSMGIKALHKLCLMINKLGIEAYVNSRVAAPGVKTLYGNEPKLRQLIIDGAIAVYPEISKTNYLWSKNPVGWLLNYGEFYFESDGMVFAFQKSYGDYETMYVLDIENFFQNDKKWKRKYNLLYIGKGDPDLRINDIKDKTVINLYWPKNRKQLAKILKQAKCLYTFDANTAITVEARLCGCPVVLFENKIRWNNTKEFLDGVPGGSLGVATSIEGIDKAREEIPEYTKIMRKEINRAEMDIFNFVKITQEWAKGRLNVKAENCLGYN